MIVKPIRRAPFEVVFQGRFLRRDSEETPQLSQWRYSMTKPVEKIVSAIKVRLLRRKPRKSIMPNVPT